MAATSPIADWQLCYAAGVVLYNQKDYPEAIKKFQEAIALKEDYAEAYNGWGVVLYSQKDYPEAIKKFQKALELKEDFAEAYNNWGLVLYSQKGYPEAIEKFQKATELKEEFAEAHYNWGLVLYNQKDYPEALKKFQKTIDLKEDYALAYNGWGMVLYNQKDYPGAIKKFQKAIDLKEDFAEAYNNWGMGLYSQKHYPEAIKKFQKAIDLKEDFAEAYNGWGVTLHRQKDYPEAIKKFQKATELKEDFAEAYNGWGLVLYSQKDYKEAIKKFQKATDLNEDFAEAYNGWGWALYSLYLYEDAIKKCEKAIKLDPNVTSAYHNKAYILWKLGRYREGGVAWDGAYRAYERIEHESKRSRDANAFYSWGTVIYEIFGDLNKAKMVFEEGLGFDPEHSGILSSLVSLYLDEKEESREEIAGGEEPVPGRAFLHSMAREDYRKAALILKEQLQRREDASTLRHLGELLLKMEDHTEAEKKKYAEAERYLMRALARDNETAATYVDLGVLFTRREDFRRAVQYFEDSLRRDPDDLNAWSNLAETYLKLKLYEKAESEYHKILSVTSDHVESHIGLGQVYTEMGDQEQDADIYERAVHHFTQAIKLGEPSQGSKLPRASKILKNSELAVVYYLRGYVNVKRYEASKARPDQAFLTKAREDFKQCLSFNRDHHKAERAVEKLDKRLTFLSSHGLTERFGPVLILSLSFVLFCLGLYGIFKPEKTNLAYYVSLAFGSLAFMVVGLYLPQILKLKVAGIEIEKSSVEQISPSDTLGINKSGIGLWGFCLQITALPGPNASGSEPGPNASGSELESIQRAALP